MDFTPLHSNLTGVAAEMCLKLGAALPQLSLNYPLSSLNALLGTSLSQSEMERALRTFGAQTADSLGGVGVQPIDGGFCLTLPAKGVAYAMAHAPGLDFLKQLVTAVSSGCTQGELLALFRRYSPHVHVEKVDSPEFDTLVYFEDGVPDAFYYCIHTHEGRVEYHRFSKADYEAFGF